MVARSVLVSLALCFVACGSSNEEGLYSKGGGGSPSGGSGGGNSGDGGSTTGGSTGDGGTSTGGSTGEGGSATGGASGDGGSAGAPSGGSTGTGGAPAGGGGSPGGGGANTGGSTAGGGGNPGGGGTSGSAGTGQILCGDDTCTGGEFCCMTYQAISGWKAACQTGGCIGTPVKCDDQSDCTAGNTCCGHVSITQLYYDYIQCVPAGQCGDEPSDRLICGGHPEVCQSGSCKSSTILPQYSFCG